MGLFKFDFLPRYEVNIHLYALIIFTFCVCPIFLVFAVDILDIRSRKIQPKGCRKLGLRIPSYLTDQYDAKYLEGLPPGPNKDGEANWRVKSLMIYPIKSCIGVELNRSRVVDTGLEYDRQFSFAQERPANAVEEKGAKWLFITQRQYTALAKVNIELWVPDPNSPTYSPKADDVQSGGVLVVSYPAKNLKPRTAWGKVLSYLYRSTPTCSFRVPFNPSPEQIKRNGYQMEKMTIWKDSPEALNMGVHIPQEFHDFLHLSSRLTLFRVAQGYEREVFRSAPRKDELGRQPVTGFADAYPIHLQNLASVRDVGVKIKQEVPQLSAIRFRPNIIITGPAPYAEDGWKLIRIGGREFYVVCRTARCRLPNIDPATAVRHPAEPARILKSFRCVDAGAGEIPCLGMELVPREEVCDIKVGNEIEVLEEGEHCYIPQ